MINGAVLVKAGELKTAAQGKTLATLGLGSCVAVALFDPETGVGGLAHVLLPAPADGREARPPGRYAASAVPALIEMLAAEGAVPARMQARLVGGASMFPSLQSEGLDGMGARNLERVREALGEAGIPVVGEDVGGTYGRSVYFRVADGHLVVRSVHHPERVL